MNGAQASFICGMGTPWTPGMPDPQTPVVAYQPPRCEHCFCTDEPLAVGKGKHLRCCKCGDHMAEKFVKAWFDIWNKERDGS